MNIPLLRRIKKHILAEPKRLKMFSWIVHRSDRMATITTDDGERPFAKCGTAACIAGWACLLEGQEPQLSYVADEARTLLGLNNAQAEVLFSPLCWPRRFRGTDLDDGSRKSAQLTAKRIEHFIKTKGRE